MVVAVSWLAAAAQGQEWTRFRGPNGSGLSSATTIPTQWTESDYNWHVTLPGIGHSSPVIWGDKVFVTSADEETAERLVLCLSADDGRVLWKRNFPSSAHHKHLQNSFASSTPALDQNHVYVCWTTPEEYALVALTHDGDEAWHIGLGPFVSQHSGGTSPIVYRDMVVLGNDQDGVEFSDGRRLPRRQNGVAASAKAPWWLIRPPVCTSATSSPTN